MIFLQRLLEAFEKKASRKGGKKRPSFSRHGNFRGGKGAVIGEDWQDFRRFEEERGSGAGTENNKTAKNTRSIEVSAKGGLRLGKSNNRRITTGAIEKKSGYFCVIERKKKTKVRGGGEKEHY